MESKERVLSLKNNPASDARVKLKEIKERLEKLNDISFRVKNKIVELKIDISMEEKKIKETRNSIDYCNEDLLKLFKEIQKIEMEKYRLQWGR